MAKTCKERGCITILSRFNPEEYCSVHALPRWRGVTREERRTRNQELNGEIDPDNGRYAMCRMTGCFTRARAMGLCNKHYVARRRILERIR